MFGGFFLLFLSAVIYWLGFSMLRPMLALYLNEAGYSLTQVGLLMALHAFIPVLLAMPAGQIIDRIGPRQAVMTGALIMALSGGAYIISGVTGALLPVLAGQLCNGVGSLLCWGALQASVGQIARTGTDAGRSNHLLSNFAFVNALAQFAGPVLGGIFADAGSFTWVFILFTVLSIVVMLCSLLFPPAVRMKNEAPAALYGFWKSYASGIDLLRQNRPFGTAMLYNGILFILVDIQGVFLPIYLAQIGYSNTRIGTMLSAGGVASIVIRPAAGFLVNRFSHSRMMSGSLWCGCFCLVALMFEPGYLGIMAVIFIWGLSSGMNQPLALILVANTVDAQRQGMGMSLRTMANRVVQVINPVAIGGISAVVGLTYSFGCIAALLMAFSFMMKKRLGETEYPSA